MHASHVSCSPDEDVSEEAFDVSDEGEGEQEAETGKTDSSRQELGAVHNIPPTQSQELQTVEGSQSVEHEIVEAAVDESPEELIMEVQKEFDSEQGLDDPNSNRKRSTDAGKSAESPITEPLPFFYYVTPKRFREASKKKDKDKLSTQESDMSEQSRTSPALTPKSGVNRLREWLQRREADDQVAKVEDAEPGEPKEGSLRRLLHRSKSGATDTAAPVRGIERADTKEESVKDSSLSRRRQLMLAFRQRPHSEEAPLPMECRPSPSLEESQLKSHSLTRPHKLWIGGRSQSERQASPGTSESSPVTLHKQSPVMPIDKERRKRTFNLFHWGTRGRQKCDTDASESSKDDATQHLSCSNLPLTDTNVTRSEKSETSNQTEGNTGKFKNFFKQRSETILRPFSRHTTEQEKRKSAPVPAIDLSPPQEPAVEISSLEARHPSISTYIDDTPVASVPPLIPPEIPSPELHPQPVESIHPDPLKSLDSIRPEHPQSPDHEGDSIVLDLHSMHSTPDVVRKAPSSRGSTLSRRLTFSLPFGSAGGGGAAVVEEEGLKPVERAIEARSHSSDYIGSMVRCLHLTKCFIANSKSYLLFFSCHKYLNVAKFCMFIYCYQL